VGSYFDFMPQSYHLLYRMAVLDLLFVGLDMKKLNAYIDVIYMSIEFI
jgi:hypothetical protein